MNKQRLVSCALLLAGVGCCGRRVDSSRAAASSKKDAAAGYYPGSGGSAGSGGLVINVDAAAARGDVPRRRCRPSRSRTSTSSRRGRAQRFVYVANPSRNTVTAINSETLAITEQAPGDSPTYLATVPGQDVALVINTGSHTLRVLNRDQLDGDPIPIVAKANAIAIAPDGMHAVVWFDAAQQGVGGTPAPSVTGSTQEVSVVDLSQSPAESHVDERGLEPQRGRVLAG